jgi:antitoxin (DNA-binding transcriptional repressor) of toxin-antitoxin stability system
MTQTVSVELASANLSELIHALGPGDEIVVTDNNQPIARIVPSGTPVKRKPGAWKGKLEVLDDSDDTILHHFQDYLP